MWYSARAAVYPTMMVQHAVPDRSMDRLSTDELDWDALYADLAPRVYNYFRYRMGSDADVEELTSRTFERAWRSRSHYRRDLAGPCTNKLIMVDTFANIRRMEKVIEALDTGEPYKPEKCEDVMRAARRPAAPRP